MARKGKGSRLVLARNLCTFPEVLLLYPLPFASLPLTPNSYLHYPQYAVPADDRLGPDDGQSLVAIPG